MAEAVGDGVASTGAPAGPAVGRRVPSVTNVTLAAGQGTFVNDVKLPGLAHLAILRSPLPHARIRAIDATAARARDGVLLVFSAADVEDSMDPIPTGATDSAMGARGVTWYAFARERVRYVGEVVAAVVAEDAWTAEAALDDIVVDYEELPAVTDPHRALEPQSPLVEPDWGDNVILRREFTRGDVARSFDEAERVVSGHLRSNRLSGSPIEPRGCVADYDPHLDRLTYWDATQQPHILRTFLAETLRLPEGSVRVIQPHVGGAFGLKQPLYQEQAILAEASRRVGRPVKWIEQRAEGLTAGGHSRDTQLRYEVAFGSDGVVAGLKVRILANVGAPTSLLGWTMSFVTAYCLPTLYDVPNVEVELASVVTNTCPWAPYRGFGKDVATFVMDRVIDHVGREAGLSAQEVRRRNLIAGDDFPHELPSGGILDSGDYAGVLDRLAEVIDEPAFRAEQAAARAEGRRIGLGLGQELTPEGVAIPGSLMNSGYDGATVRIDPVGGVTVLVGVTSPGSGSETGLAQIAADTLGVPLETVRVVAGDTEACPYGLGNYSSRSVMIGGSAVREAALQLRTKLGAVAGSMLGAGPDSLVHAGGDIGVPGEPHRVIPYTEAVDAIYRHPFGEHADGVEPGLEATRYWRIGNIYHQPETQGRFSTYPTWPNGACACVVEVDEDTGIVRLLRWVLVEDAGVIINPLLAEANLHGAIAQGIGSALYEDIAYDDAGQLLTATLMDYTIPTAVELPALEIGHHETPSPFTPLGAKGVGESGIASSLGAIAAAIEDAFPELDLRLTELPFSPQRVWRAIGEARARVH